MRDIRPAPNHKPELGPGQPPEMLPEHADIPIITPKPTPKPKPRLTGEKVPVSNVQIPDTAYVRPSDQPPPDKEQPVQTGLSKRIFNRNPVPAPLPAKKPAKPVSDRVSQGKPKVRLGHRERIIMLGLLGLAALVAVLATVIFLPKADIKLVLRTAPLLIEEKLTLQAQGTAGDTVIPGTAFFREAEVEGTSAVESTTVVGTKTKGTVELVNRARQEQKIKEQSRLVTKEGTLFYTQQAVTLPAAGDSPTRVPVTVEADQAGVQGNIEPQRLNFAALDASAQSLVYAEVTQKLSGGSGETVSIVQDADIAKAKEAAGKQAHDKVEGDIRQELPKGWVILEESWTTTADTFDTTAKVGDKIKEIPYKARVTVRVMGYEQEALEKHLKASLEKHLDQDYMLFPGAISYTKTVDSVDWQQAMAIISVRVTHTTIPKFSLDSLKDKLAGRSVADAKTYLEGLPGVRSVTIKTSPFWVNSVTRIQKRINLDLQPERQP